MPYVKGFLNIVEGEVDNSLPGYGNVDNTLPPGVPPIGSTLPEPPPGIWPPISWLHPIQPLPPGDNTPPGTIWPPVRPTRPGNELPTPPATPGTPLPTPPSGTLPVHPGSNRFWIVAGIPGVGWRYVCVDPSLSAGTPLPPAPEPKK